MSPIQTSREPGWWRSAVVYQIYPRSFSDSTGNGFGDLRGVLSRLDYLQLLGVDVLWLSPFYPSPEKDNGYDVSDYCAVDPRYGQLSDFDDLIVEVHRRGMKLIVDLVLNHTSDQHPWFVESRSSTTSPKRDWYWWRPARPGMEPGQPGAEPTNWASFFSGPTWTLDPTTDEYYLHLFASAQPDLNWENPEVREAVKGVMQWWIDRGVDGFRLDVINLISKAVGPDGSLPDGVGADGELGDGMPFTANGPRIHEFLAEMHRSVLADQNLLVVGETPFVTIEDAQLYTDPSRGEVDMVFTFEHVELDTVPDRPKWELTQLKIEDLKATLHRWQDGLAEKGWNSLYWNNHDQPRIVSRWGDHGALRVESAKTLATVLHMLKGTPYIYQGEELGMTNAGFTSLEEYRDIESLNYASASAERGIPEDQILVSLAAKSRDNARTPMQWTADRNASFTTGTPWLGVNPNHQLINAEAAMAEPSSVFHHYRQLIALRHELEVLVEGDTELLAPHDPKIYAYQRRLGDAVLTVVANLSATEAVFGTEPTGSQARPFVESDLVAVGRADEKSQYRLILGPWSSRVLLG